MKKRIFTALITLVCVPAFLLATVLLSRYGAQTVLTAAAKFVPGELIIGTVQGRLVDKLVLSGIQYSDETIVANLDQLSLTWSPGFLIKKECMVRSLDISGINITTLETEPSANDPATAQKDKETFSFPLTVTVRKASVESVSITTPEQSDPIRIESLQLQGGQAHARTIQFGSFSLAAPAYKVQAGGEIQLEEPLAASLEGSFSFQPEGYEAIAGNVRIAGTFDRSVVDLQLEKPFKSQLSGSISDLAGDARWQAEFIADEGQLSQIASDWPGFAFSKFKAEGNGTIDTYSLHVDTIASYDWLQGVHLATRLNGDVNGLILEDTKLALNRSKLGGNGKLDWQEKFSWQADIKGSDILLSEVNQTWPQVRIAHADVSGHGILDTYSLDVKGRAEYAELKDVSFSTGIKGDGNGIQLTDTALQLLDGSLAGKGRVDWQEGIAWQADISGRQLNPATIKNQWPGRIDFSVNTDGTYADNLLAGTLDIVSAQGELRGYPLEAEGKLIVEGETLTIDSFFLHSKSTEVAVSGSIADIMDMQYKVDSTDLSVLWPDLTGKLKAAGSMTGKRSQPVLELELKGSAISLNENSIGEIEGSVAGDFAPGGNMDGSIHASRLILAGQSIDTVSLAVKGAVEQHNLQGEMSADNGFVRLSVAAGLADDKWTGEISNVEIEAGQAGSWSLSQPGSIHLSRKEPSVVDVCLSGIDSSLVCFKANLDPLGQWQAVADIHFPFSILDIIPGVTAGESTQDKLTGTFSLVGTDSIPTGGELNLAADNLRVQFMLSADRQQTVTWKTNKLHALFKDRSLFVSLNSVLQDDSFLTATATVDEFVPAVLDPAKMIVDAKVEYHVQELSPLEVFTFPMAESSGTMQGIMTVHGPVALPSVSGNASLKDGRIFIPPLGITLNDLSVNLKGNDRSLSFTGSCSSDSGPLKINGVAELRDDGQDTVQLNFSGDRFEVLRLPEWRLKVSPELKLMLTRKGGELQGTIYLQEGAFSPHSFAGRVSASRDVVIRDEQSGLEQDQWPFSADIIVVVEDDVHINAFGLKGSLAGKLQVADLPGKPVIGTGQLQVNEGKFTIYGRELDIRTGKLLFSGGEIDNPGVAVRAENTTQGIKTGVAVSGFLKEPELSFYSDPPMEENEIIARLLMNTSLVSSSEKDSGLIESVASDTGLDPLSETIQDVKKSLRVDDVKVESGKTDEDLSLVIGTWLTPRLYVSYGKNLLKESGSFNTRYVLGKGFSLETESGSTESGFDFKFEIDR